MATQGERQNYNWRPNDYSSTTLHKYDMEAEHWTKAFRNASSNHTIGDIVTPVNSMIGVINLILSILSLILIILIHFVKWLRSLIIK
jgi:hypothetical protein